MSWVCSDTSNYACTSVQRHHPGSEWHSGLVKTNPSSALGKINANCIGYLSLPTLKHSEIIIKGNEPLLSRDPKSRVSDKGGQSSDKGGQSGGSWENEVW